MKKKILLTRPQTASKQWSALLARRGLDSLIDPVLVIEPTLAPRPFGNFQAVFITSTNALATNYASLTDLFSLPCYCVGASTGEAARLAGFTTITCGASDSTALAQLALENLTDTTKPLLHIAGDQTDAKMATLLSANKFVLTPWIVYRTIECADFTAATRDALAQGAIAAIPVFSPRSAKILTTIIEKNHLTQACSRIIAIGLSQAVADVLQNIPWERLLVATAPTEEDVLAILESL